MAGYPTSAICPLGSASGDYRQLIILITTLLVVVIVNAALTPIAEHHPLTTILISLLADDLRPQHHQDPLTH